MLNKLTVDLPVFTSTFISNLRFSILFIMYSYKRFIKKICSVKPVYFSKNFVHSAKYAANCLTVMKTPLFSDEPCTPE